MRSYRAHFSFYSEEYGTFDDFAYKVEAESPFDAREKAWQAWDRDEDSKFRSCVKLYAVTWNPNPLDAGDYFYSHAADIKQAIGYIENVDVPNDRIQKQDRSAYYGGQKHYYLGSLQTVDAVAKDLYAARGIFPPSVYEELHYAEELCGQIDDYNQSQALWDKVNATKKWDKHGYLYEFRDLFKSGYTSLCGEIVRLQEHFDRNGIYPAYADLDDTEYHYIHRWQSSWKIGQLTRLQPLQSTDAIPHSASHMIFDGYLLLLNPAHFSEEYEKPENMIWTTGEDTMNITEDMMGKFLVDNVITRERMLASRDDFIGVLRPDVAARYDFEALKAEYSATHEKQPSVIEAVNGGIPADSYDEQDWEKGMEP